MVEYAAEILKYAKNGEKTGWTFVEVPLDIAEKCTNLINIGRNLEMDYLCETQITNRLKEGVVLNQLLF